MITLKLKYITDNDNMLLIHDYQKQYNHCLRFVYNRFKDNPSMSQKEVEQLPINNIPLMDSYFKRCSVKHATELIKKDKESDSAKPIIFGGKSNFIKRCKHQITKEQFNENRLLPLYSIGEANQKGNRKFELLNTTTVLFKPNKQTHITLDLVGIGHNRTKYLSKLLEMQEDKTISITYKLDKQHIYISFDEAQLMGINKVDVINNRIMAIDLNPNYIGWSVVDWLSSNTFNIIKTGIYSIKALNDSDFDLKGKGYSSDSKERLYISNKRKHETLEISKSLVNIAKHYKCEAFCIEELKMKTSDKKRGKKYNRLVNNAWNRDCIVNNITKRCNVIGIKVLTVKANYSSFIGNFLYRDLGLADMILASVEIGRRGYEYKGQYIDKIKERKCNIIIPDINEFWDRYAKSLEEFGIDGGFSNMVELYYWIKEKTPKLRYRVSLEQVGTRFFRYFSHRSKIMQTY